MDSNEKDFRTNDYQKKKKYEKQKSPRLSFTKKQRKEEQVELRERTLSNMTSDGADAKDDAKDDAKNDANPKSPRLSNS